MLARIADFLERQPPTERRIYSLLIAITVLTVPCYLTGIVLLAVSGPAGDVPSPPTDDRTVPTAAAPSATRWTPPTAVERATRPRSDEPPTAQATATDTATAAVVPTWTATLATPSVEPTWTTAPSTPTPMATPTSPATETAAPTDAPTASPAPTEAPTAAPTTASPSETPPSTSLRRRGGHGRPPQLEVARLVW